MQKRWLNWFLHISGSIARLKLKLIQATGWQEVLRTSLLLMIYELGFLIVSLPLFVLVSPNRVQEEGWLFPKKTVNVEAFHVYTVRRKISLFTFGGAGALYVSKVLIIGIISLYLFGATSLLAAIQNWDFTTAGDYTYDSAKIEVTGGVGRLKDNGSTTSGATTNPSFDTNVTGWTNADWLQPSNTTVTGTRITSGGNPNAYINMSLSATRSNRTMASYWRQSFTTTVSNPDTATIAFDWRSVTFTSPHPPQTYHLYAFVDTGTGVPTLGTQVWDSGEISGTTSWASVSNIDVHTSLGAAGTYVLKIAAYATSNATTNETDTYVSGFDNVQLNWSNTTHVYDTSNPTIRPNTSLILTGAKSWNGFTETATKNGGEIYYQLSSDDGTTWQYWNGFAWATAGASNYNIATVINSNIATFTKSTSHIMWKAFLSSNGTQQVILDNIALDYTDNTLPSISGLTPAQGTSTGRVYINYNLVDPDADPVSLSAYEYSLTGAFTGEQVTMTAATGDPQHSGVTGLTSSSGGTAHTFVWDAFSQLGAVYNTTVYVRLRANDGVGNGTYATSTAFTVDYVNPVVANIVTSQTLGSTNVSVTYDLTDNTSDNLTVELQVSSDNGSTWTVPATSVTGAVGSGVSTGTGKIITWNAGVDYPGHQSSMMKVRVRAKDKYQNQGSYVLGSSFSLDTLAPAILTTANLQAQPNAGDTTVLIGGSFTEVNPNTNDFSVAINGGAYGATTAGTMNTATPSNQATAVGSTLTGHDYISSVKILHTDDYGNSTPNENTSPTVAYKYVRPYTPQAPTLTNPVTTVLDLTINPNVNEVSDVQYAMFETTTNQYVQSNGTLGVSAVWQVMGTSSGQWGNNTGVSGKVHVSGLSSPVANYIFKVKSRNPSDAAHAASSESAFSATAQITNTAPSISFGSISQTTDGTKYVTINYTGTDGQGDVNSLTVFEYSTDNSTWHTMTEKSGVGSEGTTNLTFLPTGSVHVFKWDVGTDLASVEDTTVYVRLRASDTLTTSTLATSSAFEIDTVLPVVSSVVASQNAGARTVTITYTLTDANNAFVDIGISNDGGSTWTVATTSATGHIGSGVTPGSKTITWNAGADFDNQYVTNMQVRVRARDTFGNQGVYASSANFTTDTHDPAVTNITASQDAGTDTFTVHYDVSEDAGSVAIALTISSDGGLTWVVPTTTATGNVGAGITPGINKTIQWNAGVDYNGHEKTNMQIRVTATDQFSNTSNANSSNFNLDTLAPRVTNVSAAQTIGTTTVAITYDLADQNTSLVEIDISDDAGVTWTVPDISVSGDVGSGIAAGSKTILWNAGVDFDEQAQSDLRVRVRAKDTFNHQSANTSSTNFALDTVNPVVNVVSDIQTQPNAGDTTVLIGGSFTETNPNTNDFFLALNGGAYGSASAGSTNTATPANHATPTGVSLDGNDYVSKVKIVHTDDFGQMATNENTSPSNKYVKPYTPATPTVDHPTHGTVDVTVNKNAAETDGLEYAIFETSQNKYVQSNGTLGDTAVWQTLGTGTGQWGNGGTSGKVIVNNLTTDSYHYQFKVKSRNTSDASHAASSESAFSGGASSANQSPVITLGSIAQTTDGSRYVTINYTGSDLESENSNIITAEYSTNGTVWNTMTEKSGVGSDGTVGLAFAYTGTAHDFMWDVGTDLVNTEDTTVYIRLQANDGTSSGAITQSSAFTIDTKNPVISSVTASQDSGSNNVTIHYTLTDVSNATVGLEISSDGGSTWTVPITTVAGDYGANISPGTGKTITWNPGVDLSGQETSTVKVRLHATDVFGNAGANALSANFSVDTQSPRITNVTASQNSGLNTVTIGYNIADANTSNVVIEISEDNGSTWGVATTTLSGDVGAGIAPGTGKTVTWNAATDFPNREQGGMRVRVRATDAHNNLSGNVSSSAFAVDTLAPAISNVQAVQTLGSDTVVFTYNLSDSSSANIALDISSDSGSTWTVTDTSVTGAVGSGQTSGTGKTISWNALTDYANHETGIMRVRIRGTDPYNNTSTNVVSSDFLLDTKAPVVATTSDLTAQPHAGETAATIGGSFTETNPNTNDFFVALNGGAYGFGSAGDTNTAAPTNHATPVGATLDGNDYISKVKIVHTDDYGHMATNENTSPSISYKYVKPYTPAAPTVSHPQNTSVDVAVNKNVSETDGLEYAIYEMSTGKYVQATGALGASAVWRTTAAWGTTTVTGLTSPVAQYSFDVKSRNVSDVAHAASSESDFSSPGAIANTAPVIVITSALQQTSANYGLIHYTGTDAQNDTNHLVAYEYSIDNSTWHTMTEKSGVGSDGTTNLLFTSTGTAYTFAWNIAVDLPNTANPTVYVRLRANDGLTDGNTASSSAFAIDTLGPVISNVGVSQTAGTNTFVIRYDLADQTSANNSVTLLISSDSGSAWTVPTTTLAGDVGSGVSAGTGRMVTWNAGVDFNNQENSTMRVKLQGTDMYGNVGSETSSSNFTLDTKGSVVSGVSASQVDGTNNVQVDYTLSDFSSGGLLVEFSVSSDNGSTWTVPVNTYSGNMGSGQTTGTKQFIWNAGVDFPNEAHANMKVRVRARDYFGNQGSYTSSSAFALDTVVPSVTSVSASQNTGARTVAIHYNLSDNTSSNLTVELEISEDGGSSWTVAHTAVSGAVGNGQTTGTNKLITWDAGVDFGGQDQSDMRVRVRAKDRFGNQGSFATSSLFTVDTQNPVVSNVAATQTSGTELVVIRYDLTDGTTTNLTTTLEISDDGGSTWIVPTTTAAGNVGSGVVSGTGKTISWNAGVDFGNQDRSNVVVRVKATDAYGNAGSFVNSANTSVDTKVPVVATSTDLSVQPNAGDTTVLLSGSFTETHPDTNALSVAINGGAYGLSTPGPTGSATITNQAVSVGAALDGNDYISKVKIVETDVFGHTATNENFSPSIARVYVKPYTPAPPTVENATVTTVHVSVNKNPSEVSGLEYAIFETSQNKYVQADGTLGTSAVWQTGFVWGTVTVTGLTTPVSNYVFKTKSRNSSDAAHATTSESSLSSGASVAQTAPIITINTVAQTAPNDYVLVNYTGADAQSDIVTLVTAQYSLNGTDWSDMTEKSGVGSSGKTGLSFISSGASFVFAWDAGHDLLNTEGNAFVRLMASDGTGDGNTAVSSAFVVDEKAPVVSNVNATQSAHSHMVTVTYDVTDVSTDIGVALEASSDNGSTWTVPATTVTGDVGPHVTAGSAKRISWNADLDFDGQYHTNMMVRVRATDIFNHQSANVASSAFTLDTANPVISGVTAVQAPSSKTVSIAYNLSDDTASGLTVELQISDDGGSTWTVPATSAAGNVGSGQTAGTNKLITWNAGVDFNGEYRENMKVRLRAVDGFANQGSFGESNAFVTDTVGATVNNVTASQNSGAQTVAIQYDLTDIAGTNTVTVEISDDDGATWTVPATSLSGFVGSGQTAGSGKIIVWNAGVDFSGFVRSHMKVRVQATDVYGNASTKNSSGAFTLDTAGPVILHLIAAQTNGTNMVHVSYDVSDDTTSNVHIAVEASNNGGATWTMPITTVSGNVGGSQTVGTGKSFDWNVGTDAPGQDISNARIRLIVTDGYGNAGNAVETGNLSIDTRAPAGLSNLSVFLSTTTQATLQWTSATDSHFDHYEVWYGANEADVGNRTGTAAKWSQTNDAALTNALTNTTTLTGLAVTANIYAKIWAIDVYGNEVTIRDVVISPPAPVVVSGGGGGGCSGVGCAPVLPAIPLVKPIVSPVLTGIPRFVNQRSVSVQGLAQQGTLIDVYDHGAFMGRLATPADVSGLFAGTILFDEGTHVLTAKSTDDAGNVSPFSDAVTFDVDLTPPASPVILTPTTSTITSQTPSITGTAEQFATVEIAVDQTIIASVTANESGQWAYAIPNSAALSSGTHAISAVAIDQAGNRGLSTGLALTVSPVTGPVSPPVPVPIPEAITLPAPTLPPSAEVIERLTKAIELPGLAVPIVKTASVQRVVGNRFAFSGTAAPNAQLAVYFHSSQGLIYQTKADAHGNWSVSHSQDDIVLTPGDHTIYAVALDPNVDVKSRPGPISAFTVRKNIWAQLYGYLNLPTTIFGVVVVTLVVLWLYRLKKRGVQQV